MTSRISCILIPLLLVGCSRGPDIAPVTGVITRDGNPVAGVVVEFQPDRGAPSYAFTEKDGSYSMQYQTDRTGALLGHHVIRIRTPKEITDPETGETISRKETIPKAYNDESTLELTVESGPNTYDIEIKGKR